MILIAPFISSSTVRCLGSVLVRNLKRSGVELPIRFKIRIKIIFRVIQFVILIDDFAIERVLIFVVIPRPR